MPSIKERSKDIKSNKKGQTVKTLERQLTAKIRTDFIEQPPGEKSPVESAIDSVEAITSDSAHRTADAVYKGAGQTKTFIQKKQLEIKEKKQAEKAANHTVSQPSVSQKQMKQVAVEKQREKVKRASVQDFKEPFQSTGTSTSINPSLSSTQRESSPTVREKAKANTSPKLKPSSEATGIKTRKSVEKSAAKKSSKSIKAGRPEKSTAKKAGKKGRKQIQRQGQKQLIEQTKRAAKAAAQLAKKVAVLAAKAVSALISALAGIVGGGVLLAAVCVIILVAAVVASPYGIFFSNQQQASDAISPQEAVRQINSEYTERLESMQTGDYNRVEIVGYAPSWKEVMAVFACKTAGADDGVDVTTFDTDRVERLRTIFWDMTSLSSQVQSEEIPPEEEGGEPTTERTLYITITAKSPQQMGEAYSFSADQNTLLTELLSPENNEYWMSLLYGAYDTEIVAVALSQVGNVGGQPYWSWYRFSSKVDWCACFVSWCASECGYIDSGAYPKFAACTSQGMAWFRSHGQWRDRSYTPNPGDLIFFDWDESGNADHVGIVERVENNTVYTIEGNSGSPDAVRQRGYPIGFWQIRGYGVPTF